MTRLQRAALLALCTHIVAGLALALVLRNGLETNPDLQERFAFLVNHRVLWTLAWLSWSVSAVAILYFYMTFANVHGLKSSLPVFLTVVALAPDLTAEAIEIGVLPQLAADVLIRNAAPDLFLTLHRVVVMLSGYLANGLYSATAMSLAWFARGAYPTWVSSAGVAIGFLGMAASIAALVDSPTGLFWTNALLVPCILLWLLGVVRHGV